MYIAQELLPVFSSSIMLVGALVMMFFLNVELAIVFCVTLPATYLVTRYLTRYSKEMDRRTNDQGKAQESFLYEVVSAFRTIRMFNGEGHAKICGPVTWTNSPGSRCAGRPSMISCSPFRLILLRVRMESRYRAERSSVSPWPGLSPRPRL